MANSLPIYDLQYDHLTLLMKFLIFALICSLFSYSIFAFDHHQTSNRTLSIALLKLESNLNNSVNNAIDALDPIFTINPELSEYFCRKIQDFKAILLLQVKRATHSLINKGANSHQLFAIWRKLLIRNLKKFARTVSFPYVQESLKQKEYVLDFLQKETLKYLPKFDKSHIRSLTQGLEKRSVIYNVSRDAAVILSGIITVLASWIIFTLYGLAFMMGAVVHFISG